MALRLRRGTNAERLLITPVEGELIYTTDTKLLYIGDGSTAGGTLVTGSGGGGASSLNDLTDVFASGSVDDAVLAYNAFTNSWGGVAIRDIFDIQDVLDGSSLNTDIVGDDSTVLVNVGQSQLGLGNNVLNDLGEVNISSLPADDRPLAYDGTNWVDSNVVNARINDGTDIIVDNVGRTAKLDIEDDNGQQILSHNQGHLTAPDGERMIDGSLKAAHFEGGVQTEAGFQGNVVSYDLAMTMIDSNIKEMFAFHFNGDLRGSVFADDSTRVIDGTDGYITTPNLNAPIIDSREITLTNSGTTGGRVETEYTGTAGSNILYRNVVTNNSTQVMSQQVRATNTFTTHTADGSTGTTHYADNYVFDGLDIGIKQYNPTAELDINGVMRLRPQTAAPTSPVEGMIAVADRVTWDPAAKGSGASYPVYYDGSAWNALY